MIVKSRNQYPKLMLAEGFFAYQWERNGVIISGATSNTYTATVPGKYRARFSRVSSVPTASQWNRWSKPVSIGEGTSLTAASTDSVEIINEDVSVGVFPNPVKQGENITFRRATTSDDQPDTELQAQIFDFTGVERQRTIINLLEHESSNITTTELPAGAYLLLIRSSKGVVYRGRIVVTK